MKTAQPLVSVITPLYNAEKYIGETIESVIAQTYQNWEMLIVDDGSIDNSLKIIREYEQKDLRIKVFELGYNSRRPAVPRNHAIENAQGEYLAFLDADDLWLKNKLTIQVNVMKKNPSINLTYGLARQIHDNTLSITPLQKVANAHILQFRNPIPILTVMLRTDTSMKTSLFNEDLLYRGLEDRELWLRLARSGYKFYFIRKTLALYREQGDSVRSDKDYKTRASCAFPDYRRLSYPIRFTNKLCKIIDLLWLKLCSRKYY